MRGTSSARSETPFNPERRALFGGFGAAQRDLPAPMTAERIALVREIARGWKRRLSAGAAPGLRAGDRCLNHGVCAAVCPTGALRRYEGPEVFGIEFQPAGCIACGACVVVCPESALQLEPREAAPATIERLTHHAQRLCMRCDAPFPARDEHEFCPACRKDLGLFTHGFTARSEET